MTATPQRTAYPRPRAHSLILRIPRKRGALLGLGARRNTLTQKIKERDME